MASLDRPSVAAVPLDATDNALLDLLDIEGRCSMTEVAARVGISRASVYARLERLMTSGVIERFSVVTNPARRGLAVSALILVNAEQRSWTDVLSDLAALPGVEHVALVAGTVDFAVLVRAHTVDELRDVVLEKLARMEGIRSTQTLFLLDEARPHAASRPSISTSPL